MEQLYNKSAIIKIHISKTVDKYDNNCITRGINNGNLYTKKILDLKLIKPNTTLMDNYDKNKRIKLYNQLPADIKLIFNNTKFKTMLKQLFIQ